MKNRLDRFALGKMREVLLNEMSRGYYENAANVKEFIDLEGNGEFVYNDGVKYFHVNSICIYQNDMFKVNNYYFKAMEGFPMPSKIRTNRINSRRKIRKRY